MTDKKPNANLIDMNSGAAPQPGSHVHPYFGDAPVITDDQGDVSDAAVADEVTERNEDHAKHSHHKQSAKAADKVKK